MIKDPQLSSDIKSFSGQEIQHQSQHSAFINLLESHDYQFKNLMKWWKWYLRKYLQSLPSGFRLAYTAGAEHLIKQIWLFAIGL
jgi:predicted metal-dependent hydrolase